MIKLHIFSGFENPTLAITEDMELGHLYSDVFDKQELLAAGAKVGMKSRWLQSKETGLIHFDLWATPLRKAKELYLTVTDEEFAKAMCERRESP